MIEETGLPRLVRIRGRVYTLEAPTVREALELLYILRRFEPGEREDIDLLVNHVGKLRWGTPRAAGNVRAEIRRNPVHSQRALLAAIKQGLPQSKSKGGGGDAGADFWFKQVIDYAADMGLDPWQVYNDYPFGFFVEANSYRNRAKMRRRIEGGLASGMGNGAYPEKHLNKWFEAAGYRDKPKPKPKEKAGDYKTEWKNLKRRVDR